MTDTAPTITKALPRPWKVGGQEAHDIEFREPTVEDLCEAEQDANPGLAPHAFTAALAARTAVRAGAYRGPFTPAQFKRLGARTWYVVREAMAEAEALGEDEPPATTPGG